MKYPVIDLGITPSQIEEQLLASGESNEGGFSRVRRVAEDALQMILEARP